MCPTLPTQRPNFAFPVSVSDGIGGAIAAFGDRAVIETHAIESDDSLRALTQTKYHCSAERFAEEVGVPALVDRINGATCLNQDSGTHAKHRKGLVIVLPCLGTLAPGREGGTITATEQSRTSV